ncbi:hypothetical protein QAD02_021562 [Eretmocerus hayati]|uniref:Uncharacterized protein n=1 Tax=Eretmocerus hayati TaxID=131215 RepID=A0ACC2PR35_9HYME|nr:hypothetical protein QAD02_021562 [Eretmocerus hayati]
MIKTSLKLRHNINMGNFLLIKTYLRNFDKAYEAKKAAVFRWINMETFLRDADNPHYLAMNAVSILSICGAMRYDVMKKLQTTDVKDMSPLNGVLNERNQKKFSLFFRFYSKGRCTEQPLGKNRFGEIANDIAAYLNLDNRNDYTGHSFRKTAATLLSNSGANLAAVKALGGWLSDTIPQGYIEHSDHNRMQIFEGLVSANEPLSAVPLTDRTPQPQLRPKKLFKFKKPLHSANKRGSNTSICSESNVTHTGPKLIPARKMLSSTPKSKVTCTVTSDSTNTVN